MYMHSFCFHSPVNQALYFGTKCQNQSGSLWTSDTLYLDYTGWLLDRKHWNPMYPHSILVLKPKERNDISHRSKMLQEKESTENIEK